ncbi:MAG: hypothetical protein ABFD89_17780 [Bryobacteraceae bacterium]
METRLFRNRFGLMSVLTFLVGLVGMQPKAQAAEMQSICCVRAVGTVQVFDANGRPKGEPEVVKNLITNAGRIFLHTQCYSTASGVAGGLCYIALSNDTLTETAASTTLSTEIAANGLARAQGTVTLPTGSGTSTTITKTFTCITNPQASQKAALFAASSAGTMCHVLSYAQKSLAVGESLAVTFTITTS